MTAKEAMRIIEQRNLTAPEAYEIVHALFEAEKREADVERLKMDAEHLQYERDEAREKLSAAVSMAEERLAKNEEAARRIAELELALSAETSGLLERAERAEAREGGKPSVKGELCPRCDGKGHLYFVLTGETWECTLCHGQGVYVTGPADPTRNAVRITQLASAGTEGPLTCGRSRRLPRDAPWRMKR